MHTTGSNEHRTLGRRRLFTRETWLSVRPLENVDAPVGIIAVRVPIHVRVEEHLRRPQPEAIAQELRNARSPEVSVVHDREVGRRRESGGSVLARGDLPPAVAQRVRGLQERQRVRLELVRLAAPGELAVPAEGRANG